MSIAAAARTYGRLEIITTENGRPMWEISQLEPHVAIRLKQLFPRVPKQSTGPFQLPHDNATDMDLHWFTQRYPLAITADGADALEHGQRSFIALQAEMERILLPTYESPDYVGLQPGQQIRHYQIQAIELAARSQGLLLGDECGLGKTFTGAAFCLEPSRLPAAVVCQVHIQRQWAEVIQRFTTLQVHAVTKARPYELPPADIYIWRYSQIAGWVDMFEKLEIRTVIYDEPQELRTGASSAKGQGAGVLSKLATWRMGLTATPIYNYGVETYQIMQFIAPGVLGDWYDFCREYAPDGKRLKDPKALGTFLREQYVFLRRTKADVGKELPPVNRIVDTVAHDDATMHEIDDIGRQLAIKASTGNFIERGNAARDLDLRVRHATGVAKAKHIADIVRVLVEGGEPVLLMGWHRDVYDIWLKRLKDLSPVMYTGSESPAQKAQAKADFLSGKSDLMIMSLRSAAGLDGLQARCSTIVFGELDWSPGIHHQCIERLDREGQEKPVTALFLVADEGSDPPMMEVLGLKASEAHQVIDPSLGVQAVHSDTTHLQRLVERYLNRRLTSRHADIAAPANQMEMADV